MSIKRLSNLLVLALGITITLSTWVGFSDVVDNPGPFVITATGGHIKVGNQQFDLDPANPPSISGSVDAAGNLTIPTEGIEFPDAFVEVPVIGVITVRIEPQGPATGTLNPLTGDSNINVSLRVRLIRAGILPPACGIGPVSANLTIGSSGLLTGVPYDSSVGTATYVNNEFGVPRSSGCGFVFGPIIDTFAGLPSNPPNNEIVLSTQYDPIFSGS